MNTILKYKIIKDKNQYDVYCNTLHELLGSAINAETQDEIELLTLLIEYYDRQHNGSGKSDPITLLRSFMEDHRLKPHQLAAVLHISDGDITAVLNYKKRLSKVLIRKLAAYFKVREEAFNTYYQLKNDMEDQEKNKVTIDLAGIGAMIQQARSAQGMSQEQLAAKCGVTNAMINKIETEAGNAKIAAIRNVIENGLGGRMELSIQV